MNLFFRFFSLASFSAIFLARAHAQGGPPMITDDPGTPGNNNWEINLAWTDTRTPGSTEFGLPLLDANYGVGDRLQINYQASWNVLRDDESSASGYSDSQLALKWRFYDAGEHGLQLSMYPRVTFLNPDSASGRRDLADPNTTLLLPFEVQQDFDLLSVDVDFGHTFCSHAVDRGWTGGLCVGREVVKGFELDAEWHTTTDEKAGRSEQIVNFGSRYDFSKHATLLLAVGRDLSNTLGPKVSLLTYLGIQLRM